MIDFSSADGFSAHVNCQCEAMMGFHYHCSCQEAVISLSEDDVERGIRIAKAKERNVKTVHQTQRLGSCGTVET